MQPTGGKGGAGWRPCWSAGVESGTPCGEEKGEAGHGEGGSHIIPPPTVLGSDGAEEGGLVQGFLAPLGRGSLVRNLALERVRERP